MTSTEQTGRTIEEATEIALKTLGVTEDEVDIEIIEEGSRGFLGLGQAPARVRVTLKSPARRKVAAPAAAPVAEAPKPARKKPEPAQKKAAPAPPPPRARKKSEPTPSPAPTPEAAPPAAPVEPVAGQGLQAAAGRSREVLQRILDGISSGASAEIRSAEDGQVVLEMKGGDSGILIGKHGQTINAIQYLVGVMTNRQLEEKVRVVVDAEGYRGRREEALRNQALYLASKVKESGQEAVLEALQANERRIIHLTLVNDPDVYTYSEGEDPDRRVVISPRK